MNGPIAPRRSRATGRSRFPAGKRCFAAVVLALGLLVPLGVRAQLPSFTILDSDDLPGTTYGVGEGSSAAGLGTSLAGGVDADGDGIPDLLIGAPSNDLPGQAFLVLGRHRGPGPAPLDRSEGVVAIRSGQPLADRLGAAVAFAGDADGDGLSDLLIGAPGSPVSAGGSAYLIFSRNGTPPVVDLTADLPYAGLHFRSGRPGAGAGSAVAGVGDVDGDGFADFAIGAPRSGPDPGGAGPGRIWVIFGGPRLLKAMEAGSTFDLDDLPAEMGVVIDGPAAGSLLGAALAAAGDLDGDGFADFAAGAPGSGAGGGAFILFGGREFTGVDLSQPDGTRASLLTTSEEGWELGASLAGGLDATGDRIPDLLAGAPGWKREGPSARGMAVLLPGGAGLRAAAPLDLTAPPAGAALLTGGHDERAGSAVALAPDTGGDSIADLLVGAPEAKARRGIAYLVNGGPQLPAEIPLSDLDLPLGAILLHNEIDAQAGSAVAGLGDRNGDGYGDLAVGAPLASPQGPAAAGAVYEVYVPGPAQATGTPREVRCEALPGRRILITWLQDGPYRQVEVLRNGVPLSTLPPEALFFIDTAVPPGEQSYSVRANGDPRLTSNTCRMSIRTLPVADLVCEQVPGTTRVQLRWRLADRYDSLAIAVNGSALREDLPGDATFYEFDFGPGEYNAVVYDPAHGRGLTGARCEVLVSSPPQSQVTGLDCALSVDPSGFPVVNLTWEANPAFGQYVVSRDGLQLEVVEGPSYRDESPPPGPRRYQVVGLADGLHPSPPAPCNVEAPAPTGDRAQGRVVFADSARTPLGCGRISALASSGLVLGRGQPGAEGRFEFGVSGGDPVTVVFELTLPALGGSDPPGRHRIQVAVPASAGGEIEIEVPLPVLAVGGESESPSRWGALLSALESRLEADGAPHGTLAFAFQAPREIGRSVGAFQSAVQSVRGHLRKFLAAEPRELDLVAHGSTGLAARAWLHGLPADERPIRKLVLLAAPLLGTRLAELDAHAAAAKRVDLPGAAPKEHDPFSAAAELLSPYLEEFNRRFTNLRGARPYLVAGLGGAAVFGPLLGCPEHDGRVCRESALGLAGAPVFSTGDTHESLGRSAASVGLITQILAGEAGGGGGAAPQGGQEILFRIVPGEVYSGVLDPDTSGALQLSSDTSGSIIILLNNQQPGVIDFRLQAPDGNLIDPATAGSLPGVGYHTFSDGEGHQLQSYEFDPGQVGIYTALLSYSTGEGQVPYSLQIFLDSRLTLGAVLEPAAVEIGGASVVTAKLALNGGPVPDAAVAAEVHCPDGGFDSVVLRDDGQAPDASAGDGLYSGTIGATPAAGLYLVTVRASGTNPLPFLREETTSLVVHSRAAAFAGEVTAGTADRDGDGMFEGLWIAGGIRSEEAGSFLINGRLTDLAGNLVAQSGILVTVTAPEAAPFELIFDGGDIFASGRDGPYLLKEIEVLDGNRGFILCERRSDALSTGALSWTRFGQIQSPQFVRGDANGDEAVDLSDAMSILNALFLANFEIGCSDAADANADRSMDIADSVYLLDALFLDGAPPPAPFPACGASPALGCPRYEGCK